MNEILTSEEKKYLNMVCNYLKSMGMSNANIDFEIDYGTHFDVRDINWDRVNYFDNNYRADVPDGLIPILKKIFDYVGEKDLITSPDNDDINYERIEILIDSDNRELSVNHYWSYYERGDSEGLTWGDDTDDTETVENLLNSIKDSEDYDGNRSLQLDYNGSGDSGYIESSFNEGGSVPADVEQWCYDRLENNFGGWEINEGSQGYFIFDFEKNIIELEHSSNYEKSESDTIFEVKF